MIIQVFKVLRSGSPISLVRIPQSTSLENLDESAQSKTLAQIFFMHKTVSKTYMLKRHLKFIIVIKNNILNRLLS